MRIWVPAFNMDGFYEVSNLGEIRSVARTAKSSRGNGFRSVSSKIIKQNKGGRLGHRISSFSIFGVVKNISCHRLIWESFNGKIPEGLTINHINFDPSDNSISNLECVSRLENNYHSFTAGRHPYIKPFSIAEIEEIKKSKLSSRKLGAIYGVSQSSILKIKHNKTYRHYSCQEGGRY